MTRRVVLVVGPPGAGKSTWVRDRAQRGDVVVDFDDIARTLGSRSSHRHPPGVVAHAILEQKRQERAVALMADGTAYVVRVASNPTERAALAARLRASEVRVVDPGRDVVTPRLGSRPASAAAEVDRWYRLNG